MDNEIIENLIDFASPFYLNGDFDTYDEFHCVVVPLLFSKLQAQYITARTKLEKSNPELLEKYIQYFSVKYQVTVDTVKGFYNDN